MKKTAFVFASILCISLLCSACQLGEEKPPLIQQNGTVPEVSSPVTEGTESPTQGTDPVTPSTPNTLPEYQPGSIVLAPRDDNEMYPIGRKYRASYYWIRGPFMALLTEEQEAEFAVWTKEQGIATDYGRTRDEMYLVSFIKRFNIPREDFDAALAKYISSLTPAMIVQEEYEPPNGDIIYTFDNEIINYYYRYA